jgi:AcrR family transcriptional regulator
LREADILRATLEELASSDYGGLTIEQVAARAGVNKTTVYRHWPTKVDLVRAALASVAETHSLGPSSGSLRTDLLRIGRNMIDFVRSFEGQCLMRLRLLDRPEPELAGIAESLQAGHDQKLKAFIDSAIARGELRPDVDGPLLLDMLGGALYVRFFLKRDRADDVLIARFVDTLLEGVRAVRPLVRAGRKARRHS